MHRLFNKRRGDAGFTLIELLVVVVIIGVLVAIAVPVYLNYRKGAADKTAQSDVRGAISAIEQYYTENNNDYPSNKNGTGSATVKTIDLGSNQKITLSDQTELYYVKVDSTKYRVCARNNGGSGKVFVYDSSVGGSVEAKTVGTFSNCA